MRPIWSGAMSFGLINIPINLYSAAYDRDMTVHLHMLHKKDLSPIRYAKICKQEDCEVPYEEIVKGYEYEKGKYVVISEEDLEKALPKQSKSIEIQCFVNEDEIDPIYFEKPYFLEPGRGAAKSYLLLSEALKKSKKVGVATFVIHSKEHLGIIKPHGRGIILNQIRFESDLRNIAEIELPVAKIQPKEVDIAVKLIEQLTEPFKPQKFKDTYSELLKAAIAEKTKGKKPSKKKDEEVELTPVNDIMKQLKASLEKYGPHKRTVSRVRRRKIKS